MSTVQGNAQFRRSAAIDASFDLFYSSRLRAQADGRVRSVDVRDAYNLWAIEMGAPPISYTELRKQLQRRQHHRIHSNFRWFTGLVLVKPSGFDQPVGARPALPPALASQIARIARDLDAVREQLERLGHAPLQGL